MSTAWGVAIPGLAMNASEIPAIDGLIALQNPEIGEGLKFEGSYSLYDAAEVHLKTILSLLSNKALDSANIWILGMSMGGMINSILASTLRSRLPGHARFGFLVTTPNLRSNPAIPDTLLAEWMTATPGNVDDFHRILGPFFGPRFLAEQPDTTKSYFEYRALGRNQQSPRAFFRQMTALRTFDGEATFKNIDPRECKFIGGADDKILGPTHNIDLRRLAPEANHIEVADLGHMVNLERPELFDLRGKN